MSEMNIVSQLHTDYDQETLNEAHFKSWSNTDVPGHLTFNVFIKTSSPVAAV